MEGVPVRPHGALDDLAWGLLEQCWTRTPEERPPIAEVYRTLKFGPKATHIPRSPSAIGELPGMLLLHVHSINFSEDQPGQQQFYVKLRYGDREYTTSPTNYKNEWGGHTWFALRLF